MSLYFSEALITKKQAGFIPVIPDIKCFSPREGDLLRGREPLQMARLLADAGAPALSVVTEPRSFGGSLKLLEQVAAAIKLPVLRKDFITSPDEVKITRDCGAKALLLICALLDYSRLLELYEEALKIGLEPLVEVHNREDLILAGKIGAQLVGINNRNILELETDSGTVATTEMLADCKPPGSVLISESSIRTPAEAQAAFRAGADAVLVGTAIWQAEDPRECYLALSGGTGDYP